MRLKSLPDLNTAEDSDALTNPFIYGGYQNHVMSAPVKAKVNASKERHDAFGMGTISSTLKKK